MEQYTGVASSLLAFYLAGALAINGEARREILPLGQPLFEQATLPAPTPLVRRSSWRGRGGSAARRCQGARGKARGRLLSADQ